jgi:NAD(P)-dependent dehydrogenase (short-subunit alcohol dehydrogenase family)
VISLGFGSFLTSSNTRKPENAKQAS